mmetsp:Transcript_27721/g.95928  ORF Transcript_27721/g.95928 Transcript_27721/m.95928 type:complete len:337 (-) Transcript_27721:84-1094(-)
MAAQARRALTLTSVGRVLEPYVVEGGGGGVVGLSWRSRWRRTRSNWESGKALRLAQKHLPGYSDEAVLSAAEAALVAIHAAFASGGKHHLRGVTTELFESALKRGMALYGDSGVGGASRPGAELLSWPEASKLVAARCWWQQPAAARGPFAKPDFFQATVRCVTLQAPIGSAALPGMASLGGGGHSGGHSGGGERVARPLRLPQAASGGGEAAARGQGQVGRDRERASVASEGEWRAAVVSAGDKERRGPDGATTAGVGSLYYWHTGTGAVQWRRPATYGVVGAVPCDALQSGAIREVVSGGATEDGRPIVRVVNYVVVERGVAAGAAGEWRACAI